MADSNYYNDNNFQLYCLFMTIDTKPNHFQYCGAMTHHQYSHSDITFLFQQNVSCDSFLTDKVQLLIFISWSNGTNFYSQILKIAPSGVYPNPWNFLSCELWTPSKLQGWGWLRWKCCCHNRPFAITRTYHPCTKLSWSTIVLELISTVQFL